jgi:S-adenosylmethionine:tRNA ribosyltransferase-isomerase
MGEMPVDRDRLLTAYDYVLPDEHIAQTPAEPRDSARLLTVKDAKNHTHAIFRDLPYLLRSGDLLVLNNTRVIPARLLGQKPTGLAVEVLLLEPQPQLNCWLALVKPGRRLKPGATILFGVKGETNQPAGEVAESDVEETLLEELEADLDDPSTPALLKARVIATDAATSGRILQFEVPAGKSFEELLQQLGQMPLPPYITNTESDPDRYQTIYAVHPGAVAAPTAGLHFTPDLLSRLEECGIQRAFITLHTGIGTFRPVETEEITQHQMHEEWVQVPPETVELIRQTKAKGGRVIAVGTTVVRSLEGAACSGTLQPFCSKTNLFIYPGYQWRVVDGLITNFHLPKSSLLMLVSAMVGRKRLLELYQVAIAAGYRFYSFGDAMLILPEARREIGNRNDE